MTGSKRYTIQNTQYKIHNTSGFTLVEVMVALTIFSVVVTMASSIFLSSQRVERKTESMQSLSGAGRLIMEKMVKTIRENEIDYDYAGYTKDSEDSELLRLPQSAIALRNFEENLIIFQENDKDRCLDEKSVPPCLEMSNDDGQSWSSLTSKEVRLKDLQFFITPKKNPFQFHPETDSYEANSQPFVLIVLTLEKTKTRPGEQSTLTLQTGVSSGVYKR